MIDQQLLREYIIHTQVLNEHGEAAAETYLEGGYSEPDEIEADISYYFKKLNKVREIESEILKELNKENS